MIYYYEIFTTTVILSHLISRDILELCNRVNHIYILTQYQYYDVKRLIVMF